MKFNSDESLDYRKFLSIFQRYNAELHINISDGTPYGSDYTPYRPRDTVSLTAKFHRHSIEKFILTINEADRIYEQHTKECKIREASPVVQQAYEEYQLLLNLIK